MQSNPAPDQPGMSPAKSNALVIAALVAALLGLTLLDVAPAQVKKQHTAAQRSADCIVASAVFAGVGVSLPDALP